jgi:ComF family protein
MRAGAGAMAGGDARHTGTWRRGPAGLGRAALPLRRLLSQAGAWLLPGECALCGGLADDTSLSALLPMGERHSRQGGPAAGHGAREGDDACHGGVAADEADETALGWPDRRHACRRGLAGGRLLCAACHRQYIAGWRTGEDGGDALAHPVCRLCANPLPAGGAGLCGYCLRMPPAFDMTVAAAPYALPLDRLVLQLKFGGRLALARLFGDALANAALAAPGFILPDVLCPVPLGPRRLVERGYNQALEMARPLARHLGVPLQARMAVRVKETAALSRTATQAERRTHIAGAFAAPRRALIEGRHIGLVDDVMTSGATMNELAALFKRHGAVRITCLVFARTPPHDDDVLKGE